MWSTSIYDAPMLRIVRHENACVNWATSGIIAVHGLGGHPVKTWTHEESGVFWLKDLLPKDLPTARIFTFGYDARVTMTRSVGGINDISQILLQAIKNEMVCFKIYCTPIASSHGRLIVLY
jgi:hypothetical protein